MPRSTPVVDSSNTSGTLLDVQHVTIQYGRGSKAFRALNDLSLSLPSTGAAAILGESGSGKTTLALSILGLLPQNAYVATGSIRFRGTELLELGEREFRSVRGHEISMIFQEPELAVNPFMRAEDAVSEVIRAHTQCNGTERRRAAREVLSAVGLAIEPRLLSAYPHQLSGGARQRLVIAQAIACKPSLLVADEPTTSLDALAQAEWIELIQQLRQQFGLALLIISHDPVILSRVADLVFVIYRGRIVEEGSASGILDRPAHPYTRALFHSVPPLRRNARAGGKNLPVLAELRPRGPENRGCSFAQYCVEYSPVCSESEPPYVALTDDQHVRCWRHAR